MQRSKARGPGGWGLLSLFCFPVFALGLGRFPELRLFRAVVDLLVGGPARLPARVLVQVVEHLAQDRLEGAESRADRRRAEPVGDQTAGKETGNKGVSLGCRGEMEAAGWFGFVRQTEEVLFSPPRFVQLHRNSPLAALWSF